MKTLKRWQWISDTFGPMGWFTPAQKTAHKGNPEFTGGHWRSVPTKEVQAFLRSVGRLAYEQA